MNRTTNNVYNNENSNDEILIAFAEALDRSPSPAVVREWMQQYPEQARTLARYAADRQFGEVSVPASAAVMPLERIRQIGLDAMRARQMATAPASRSLRSLLDAALARGLDAAGAAAALEVPFGVFVKLHRRLIAADSIPAAFLAKLAETVGRSMDEVNAYLRQPPTLAAGASYRADDTPGVGEQETFAAALEGDPESTTAQQERWL
ncbi:MAG: hypothetical protein OHK0029_02740 [Armatimonadaceae bacterium]